MGTATAGFRDRLPLSPLTLDELTERRSFVARIIANCVVDERYVQEHWRREYVMMRGAIDSRLGVRVSRTVHPASEVPPRE